MGQMKLRARSSSKSLILIPLSTSFYPILPHLPWLGRADSIKYLRHGQMGVLRQTGRDDSQDLSGLEMRGSTSFIRSSQAPVRAYWIECVVRRSLKRPSEAVPLGGRSYETSMAPVDAALELLLSPRNYLVIRGN